MSKQITHILIASLLRFALSEVRETMVVFADVVQYGPGEFASF